MKYIFIFSIFISYVMGAVQLEIANNKWQLIGVNGVYLDGITPAVFGTSGIVATQTVNNTGIPSYYVGADNTAAVVANDRTVGILLIRDAYSPTGDTELVVGATVDFEIDTFFTYDGNQTRYRMYLAGQNGVPAIRVDFQSNLSGKKFKLKFGTESIHYVAYFNPNNTFDSPQLLSEDNLGINTVNQTSKIQDVFDVNLSDNNLTELTRNNAQPFITEIDPTLDINATFYTLGTNGAWALWDSQNTIGTNGFTDLTPGRGYWSFVSNNETNSSGLILGDQGIDDTTQNVIYNGWNLVSFRDTNIRYSPTGFFIPQTVLLSGVSVSYKYSVDEVNVSAGATLIEATRQLNWQIEDKRNKLSSATHFLAYPALQIQTAGNREGIIVISDDRMDINDSRATNLSQRELQDLGYGRESTVFGDYMIGFELGQLNGSDINQTINISMPQYNSETIRVGDLNQTGVIEDVASLILDGFIQSARSSDSNIEDANVSVYVVDINSSSVSPTPTYDIVLLASTGRFSIQDGNFIRKFKLIRDGSLVVVGSQSRQLSSISQINSFTDVTDVTYIDLLNNEFMLVSNKSENLDVLENAGYTMFLDNSQITDTDSQRIAIGAIGKVYTHKNLLSPTVGYDREPLVAFINYDATSTSNGYVTELSSYINDLSGPAVVALDFPSDGPLNNLAVFGKTITQILSASTVTDSLIGSQSLLWQVTDLTKDPKDWFDTADTQEVFAIKKEKGYWINVRDFTSSSLSIDSSSQMSLSNIAHFDNNITVNGTDMIGLVTNHINHRLSLKINGLNPLISTAYDVTAIIRGRKFPLIADGIRFNIRVNDIDMELEEAVEGSTLDDSIRIQIYDGLGNTLINTDYTVSFIKPAKPVIEWKDDGEMSITSTNPYEIHSSAILDTTPQSSIILKDRSDIYSNAQINWRNVDGNVTMMRVVSKKKGVYSNMSITPFVPFKDSHILQVRNNLEIDKIPYSYISNDILKANNIEIDNGVQITSLEDQRILMSYRPENQGAERLSSFAGTTTMYLQVGTTVIAYITYIKSYSGEFFYIYHEDNLYQGVFSDDNTFARNNAPYNLESGVIDFSDLSLIGNEGNRIEFSGFSTGTQPIYEPSAIITPNGGIITPGGQQPQTGGQQPPQPILPTN